MKRLAALTLLCGILALNPGVAQERKTSPRDPVPTKRERASYLVQNADPAALAKMVGAHFQGDATLIAAPAGSGNAILVSGSSTTVPEVLRLLEQLDRSPRTVEVEITIAEMPAPKDGTDLSQAALAAAEALAKEGKGRRIKLSSVENQEVTTQSGGSKPFTSGSTVFGGGGGRGGPGGFGKDGGGGGGPFTQRSISYHQVGTTIKMTPRIGSENTIALDLHVQENKVRMAEEGGESPSFDSNTLSTKLSLPAGKPVVAQTVRTEGKAGPTISVVIVTARMVQPGSPRSKSK
jgi:hypothetical protein